jgi:hypothetical protein
MVRRPVGLLVRDYISYAAIAVGVVGVIGALALYTAKRGGAPDPVVLNWIGLGGVMMIVYVTAIQKNRARWQHARLWSGLILALLVEIGMGIVILRSAPRIATLLWAFLVLPVNTFAVDQFLNLWLGSTERR